MTRIIEVPIANIKIKTRRRDLCEDEAHSLAHSIAEIGLINPISISPDYTLLTGRHRLRAYELLGRETIPAIVRDVDDLTAELLEIDENLKRNELTVLEQGEHIIRREQVLEAMGARAESGFNGNQYTSPKVGGEMVSPPKTTENLASEIGLSKRSFQQRKQIAKGIAPDVKAKIGQFEVSNSTSQLLTLARKNEDEQREIADKIASGEAENVTEAVQQLDDTHDDETNPLPWDTEEVETPILLPKGGNKSNRKTDPAEEGGLDFCQTPPYALLPLLPYLPTHWTLWEPARGEGYLEAALKDKDFSVVSSCILAGQDFFEYTPDGWDVLVTNPPFSIKYDWLERCYELGKPFALLLPVETLGTQSGQYQFAEHGIEIILIDKRINFKMPEKGWEGSGSQFPTAWFTWGLNIGQQMTFERIDQAHINAWKRQCEAEEMAPPAAA